MHYVICYDLENDRLRGKAVKLLERHGCSRVQKSVFAAPELGKKDLVRLQLALRQCFARHPLSPGDSVYIIPLREENAADIQVFGKNNIHPELEEKPLKTIL